MPAAGLVLEQVGRVDLARKLRTVVGQVLNEDKVRTGDLDGSASTKEYAQALNHRAENA